MEIRRLGRTGVKVGEVGLGTWLTAGSSVDEATMHACVRRALDLGMNFFDTADVYAGGDAERVLGRALAHVPRGRFVIASKAFFPTGDGPNERGLSRKHLVESIDGSLERLGLRALDLFQCHRFDPSVPLEETVAAMTELVRRGSIHYWGTSEWSSVDLVRAIGIAERYGLERPASNQSMYNALQRRLEFDVLDTCLASGVGVLAYSPLAQGVLTGKYRPGTTAPEGSRAAHPVAGTLLRSRLDDSILERIALLEVSASREGWSLVRAALAFCLREPAIASVLVGASHPDQVTAAAEVSGRSLPASLVEAIDTILGTAPFDQYLGRPATRNRP